jgi:hypothetical protein
MVPKISKECVFCSVLAVVPNQNDTQLSIKIYVKEDLVEYLETESHIKGSSKYSIFFSNNSELGTLTEKFQKTTFIIFFLIVAKILIAGSSLRDYSSNDNGPDVTQVFDLTDDTIKVFTMSF